MNDKIRLGQPAKEVSSYALPITIVIIFCIFAFWSVHMMQQANIDRMKQQAVRDAHAYTAKFNFEVAQGIEINDLNYIIAGIVQHEPQLTAISVTKKLLNGDYLRIATTLEDDNIFTPPSREQQAALQRGQPLVVQRVVAGHKCFVVHIPINGVDGEVMALATSVIKQEQLDARPVELVMVAVVVFMLLIGYFVHANITAARQLEAREIAEERLREVKEEIAHFSEVQSRFMATVSREILKPVGSIIDLSSVLKSERDDTRINLIHDRAHGISSLLKKVETLSSLKADTFTLKASHTSLSILISEVSEEYRQAAQKKKLQWEEIRDEELPSEIRVDSLHLKEVLSNLLSNAVKYTDKGKITLTVMLMADEDELPQACHTSYLDESCSKLALLKFKVQDTGHGIAESEQERVLKPFERGHNAYAAEVEGTGLGLAMSKLLVERMGGKFKLKSEFGTGTTVIFSLPVGLESKKC